MFTFIIFAAIGLLLVVLGAVVRFKRAWWLINGINTYSEERRAKIDLNATCVWLGTSLMACGVVFIVGGLLTWLISEVVLAFVIPLFLIIFLVAIVHIRKFDGNNFDEQTGRETGKSKAMTIGIAAVILAPLVIILVVMLPGFTDPTVTIEGGSLVISGSYGVTVDRGDVVSVTLVNELPRLARTSGFGTGTILKGRVSGPGGAGRAFLRLNNPPYLYMELQGSPRYIYLNLSDPDDTRELHRQITAWRR